jgi:hypothetical protein
MANGLRCDQTGEVELELSKKESVLVFSALIMILNGKPLLADARKTLEGVAHAMRELGVDLDG